MPVHVVTLHNQHDYREVLPRMYRARRALYQESTDGSGIEGDDARDADRFDHDHAIYLLNLGKADRLLAACRLIPGGAPHLCHDKFRHLAGESVPFGPDVFELGRWGGEDSSHRNLQELACGVMEYAVIQGISQFLVPGRMEFVHELAGHGWSYRLIGEASQDLPNACLFCIEAGSQALAATRAATGIQQPVLHNADCLPSVPELETTQAEGQLLIEAIQDFINQEPERAAQAVADLNRTLKSHQ